MIDYVLDCFSNVEKLVGVAVIGPVNQLGGLAGVTLIPQAGSLIKNVITAAAAFPEGWLLLSTCDIPLITPEAITDYLSRCQGADLYYPLIAREDSERVYPGMERTWVRVTAGEYTGGNILLVKSAGIAKAAHAATAFFDARKSPFRLAKLIGIATLAKFILRRLTIDELEHKVSKILGINCKAVFSPFPEIGADVDKQSDYDFISSQIKAAT